MSIHDGVSTQAASATVESASDIYPSKLIVAKRGNFPQLLDACDFRSSPILSSKILALAHTKVLTIDPYDVLRALAFKHKAAASWLDILVLPAIRETVAHEAR